MKFHALSMNSTAAGCAAGDSENAAGGETYL